jgi:hypothetical protein
MCAGHCNALCSLCKLLWTKRWTTSQRSGRHRFTDLRDARADGSEPAGIDGGAEQPESSDRASDHGRSESERRRFPNEPSRSDGRD